MGADGLLILSATPSLRSGGQARPMSKGLGPEGECLPGSPCSPLRPGRPGLPGLPATPFFPSGALHTFWVTIEASDMASTQTTSHPWGPSMLSLWRHGRAWTGWTSHSHPSHTLESHAHNDICTALPQCTCTLRGSQCPLPIQRQGPHTYTQNHKLTHIHTCNQAHPRHHTLTQTQSLHMHLQNTVGKLGNPLNPPRHTTDTQIDSVPHSHGHTIHTLPQVIDFIEQMCIELLLLV